MTCALGFNVLEQTANIQSRKSSRAVLQVMKSTSTIQTSPALTRTSLAPSYNQKRPYRPHQVEIVLEYQNSNPETPFDTKVLE